MIVSCLKLSDIFAKKGQPGKLTFSFDLWLILEKIVWARGFKPPNSYSPSRMDTLGYALAPQCLQTAELRRQSCSSKKQRQVF